MIDMTSKGLEIEHAFDSDGMPVRLPTLPSMKWDEKKRSPRPEVSRSDYNQCVRSGSEEIVGVCALPFTPNIITLVIREFTPNPGGLEFRKGVSYYFICKYALFGKQ
ncbi:unnamed protein product [Soboliphyme baturini]|uniref:Ephrin RBD domain-containing protein n=1 Tax=Soboliphyme baturini TaxID=241478 RepID=A0A183ITF5_9BILA|nr:unnamed protein product [Soboliphyme baturini]